MVTEGEWLTSDNLERLLHYLGDAYIRAELGERKFILFAAACCRLRARGYVLSGIPGSGGG
jgi:hypothetical protein